MYDAEPVGLKAPAPGGREFSGHDSSRLVSSVLREWICGGG